MFGTLPEEFGPLLIEQLREQMNNLSAAIQLLTPVVREREEGRYDQYLAIMNQSLYRMIRTLNHLEFVQLPEGEVTVREESLDLAGLCRSLARQAEPLAEKVQVAFSYEEESSTLLTQGDAALLSRMLLNLISNALRAAGKGGHAGMRLSRNRDRAVITVWDNGTGLQEEEQNLLLLRPSGLGLGIPVARRIAQLHGGTLVLEQREERGLRTVVSLPVRPPEPSGALNTPKMGYDGAGGFSAVLLELSSVLPYQAFLPEDVE